MSFFYVSEIFSLIYFFIFGKWEKIRGGTRSQLRRPLFPLGLPLVGHAEKHVIKRGICGNFEGACEVVQLTNTHFPGLVSEFVEYVGGGEGVSGRGKPEEVREST